MTKNIPRLKAKRSKSLRIYTGDRQVFKLLRALTWGALVWLCAPTVSRQWLWTQGWRVILVIWKMRQLTLWPLKTPSGSTTPRLHYFPWTQILHLTPPQSLRASPDSPTPNYTLLRAHNQQCAWVHTCTCVFHLFIQMLSFSCVSGSGDTERGSEIFLKQ